jgi:hypothetical protein
MGKARAGTEHAYGRRVVTLTDHGFEQLRNRLRDLGCLDYESATDEDLANRVDRAVRNARREGLMESYIENVRDEGDQVHETCSMADEFCDIEVWPLIRSNRVITVLTKQQVQKSITAGKWRPVGARAQSPFAVLAAIRSDVPRTATGAPTAPADGRGDTDAPTPPPTSERGAAGRESGAAGPPVSRPSPGSSDGDAGAATAPGGYVVGLEVAGQIHTASLRHTHSREEALRWVEQGITAELSPRLFVEVPVRVRRKIIVEID